MKYIFIVLMALLLMLPIVMAIVSEPIEIQPSVDFIEGSEYEAHIEIKLEDDIHDRTYMFQIRFNNTIINNLTDETEGVYVLFRNKPLTTDIIEFDIIREFGNQSELFDIINTCNEMANFSHLWELCIKQRTDFELQIANEMIYKINFSEMEGNLTTKFTNLESDYETYKSNKDAEILEKNERIGDLERHRQFGWGIGIIGFGVAIYLLNKYQGFGKRKQQIETEFPKDVSV